MPLPPACCATPSNNAWDAGRLVFSHFARTEIVEKLCTDVGIIAHGQLVHQGTMEELRRAGSLRTNSRVVGNGGQEVAKAKLAGRLNDWEQLKTILWLRWRLTRNQWVTDLCHVATGGPGVLASVFSIASG